MTEEEIFSRRKKRSNVLEEEKKEVQKVKETQEEIEQIVDNLTLMDDDLMAKVFDKNIPATRLLCWR